MTNRLSRVIVSKDVLPSVILGYVSPLKCVHLFLSTTTFILFEWVQLSTQPQLLLPVIICNSSNYVPYANILSKICIYLSKYCYSISIPPVASNFFSKLQDVLKINIAKLYNPMARDLFLDKLGDFALFNLATGLPVNISAWSHIHYHN